MDVQWDSFDDGVWVLGDQAEVTAGHIKQQLRDGLAVCLEDCHAAAAAAAEGHDGRAR